MPVDIRTTRLLRREETYDGSLVVDERDYNTSFTILIVDDINILGIRIVNPGRGKSLYRL
jgi:hypothetical protein